MHRNNSTVFIFGAGVSKASAGAPVTKELFLKMKQRYEQEKKVPDPLVRNSRINEFKSIEAVINKLEGRTKKAVSESKRGEGIKIRVDTGIRENIEWLITLIDINTDYAPMFEFEKPGADVSPYPVMPVEGMSRMEMEHVRSCLNRYLYLCLCDLKEGNGILRKFFKEHLRGNDHLITFNYDVLIENALLEINKWSPVGGYFGVNQFRSAYKNIDKIFPENSPCKILKLHGSINWAQEGPRPVDIDNPPVITLHKWDSSPFFPKYEKTLGQQPEGNPPIWILPSYFKTFSKNPFLFTIWREAQRVLTQAKRLVVLGYSLPEEDSLSRLLLASLPHDCSILIVNPEGDAMKKGMNNILRSPDISVQEMGFEDWLQRGCSGLK